MKEPFFVLKPSVIEGVGVFSLRKIKKGTKLPLFGREEPVFTPLNSIKSKIQKTMLVRFGISADNGDITHQKIFIKWISDGT